MDKQWKEDWVEALRSGEYVQGRNALDRRERQCCLGVLCDIADLPWSRHFRGRVYYDIDPVLGGSTGGLPHNFRERVGISIPQEEQLIALNDQAKASFEEIADWIEVYL